MTVPRITRTGTLRAHGSEVSVDGPGHLCMDIDATPDEAEDAHAMHEQRVRITIEPADATPEEAPHGSALDYLAEAKRMLESDDFSAFVDGCGREFQDSDGCKRLLSLLNSAHLSALNYLRRQP